MSAEQVSDEIRALWTEVFGAPAPASVARGAMLDIIISGLRPADYERLILPALEDRSLVWPRRPGGPSTGIGAHCPIRATREH